MILKAILNNSHNKQQLYTDDNIFNNDDAGKIYKDDKKITNKYFAIQQQRRHTKVPECDA